MGNPLDEPLMLELEQRFSNQGLPDTELAGDPALHDGIPGLKLPGHDRFAKRLQSAILFRVGGDPTEDRLFHGHAEGRAGRLPGKVTG